MSKSPPTVYLVHGDNEFEIAQFVAALEDKLGDDASAAAAVDRLDGNSFNPDELLSVCSAMPFFSDRRLVIYNDPPLERYKKKEEKDRFLEMLEKIPPTTALVLVVHRELTAWRDRKENRLHWLERWAVDQGEEKVHIRRCEPLRGGAFNRWLQAEVEQEGGKITPEGADLLRALTDENPRVARRELEKLLAYTNRTRAIEPDDVQALTADTAQADIFDMVDALGQGRGRQAAQGLQRLLEQEDAMRIFYMVVRQFRLLLQAKELLDQGAAPAEIQRRMRQSSFVMNKVLPQAAKFSLEDLEIIYHRLLELDTGIKTGQFSVELALETFTADVAPPN